MALRLGSVFASVFTLSIFSVILTGCDFGLVAVNGGGGGNTNRNENSSVEGDALRVQFHNNIANVDVETEFYATNEPLDDPETELFVPANRVTLNIGVASTGIVQGGTTDSTDVPCTASLTIGTAGGRFLNPETGALLGTGDQRIIEVGDIFDCGDTITFVYSESDGDFTTDIDL